MGANFINSVLEKIAEVFKMEVQKEYPSSEFEILMSILSNYTPESFVEAKVSCPINELNDGSLGMSGEEFAEKFKKAISISKIDIYRATTHNKGIFNGIDAVVLATGNDHRAVEACGHTYAARNGFYEGLTNCELKNGNFEFSLRLPIAIGTVGGLTSLHPMAKFSLELLKKPTIKELMEIVVTIGLLQNFSAVKSLVTSGIQKGHMKMHLINILNHLDATEKEKKVIKGMFEDKAVSFKTVREELLNLRQIQ